MRALKLLVTVSTAFFATFQRVSPPASPSMLPLRSTSSMAFGATCVMANSLCPQPVPISHLPALQLLPAAQSPSLRSYPGRRRFRSPCRRFAGSCSRRRLIQRPSGTHTFVLSTEATRRAIRVARARRAAPSSAAADADGPAVADPGASTGIAAHSTRSVLIRRASSDPRDKQSELIEAHQTSETNNGFYHLVCTFDEARVR